MSCCTTRQIEQTPGEKNLIRGNCAKIIIISQSKKGLMVRNQENRGGAENARYGSTEVSKSPYPPSPLFNVDLMASSVVSTG